MAANGSAAPANVPLHERMQARGAKKHRRKSTLARFMIERAAEMHRLVEVDRYSWKDIAAMLSEDEGLTDNKGNPVTETIARITWSRVKAGRAKAKPARTVAAPAPLAPPAGETLQIGHAPFAEPSAGPMQIDIRPASLRRSAADATQTAPNAQEIPGVRLLSRADEAPQTDAPADRPGRRKIPPAPVL
jgi:hypothetical protein